MVSTNFKNEYTFWKSKVYIEKTSFQRVIMGIPGNDCTRLVIECFPVKNSTPFLRLLKLLKLYLYECSSSLSLLKAHPQNHHRLEGVVR